MKYIQVKSKKINNLVSKMELKRTFYKSIFINVELSKNIRQKAFIKLSSMDKRSSISYFKRRCFFSQNSRSILRFFKMSRIQFRYLASYGNLSGIRKSSW